MEAIWEKLSQPLPPPGSEPEPIVTPELREALTALLSRYEFEYLAEGRANVVFSIRDADAAPSSPSPNPGSGPAAPLPPPIPRDQFRGTLLRVPKATPGVTPCDYETLQRFHEEAVERRVGREHVVPQILVGISQELADRLDAGLRRDSTRDNHGYRHHHHVDDDDDDDDDETGDDDDDDDEKRAAAVIRPGPAMLVMDMGLSDAYPLALEFKPKWLAQSPLAPAGATRCRSCAREALRNAQKISASASSAALAEARGGSEGGKATVPPPPVCRLGLVHDDPEVFRATIDQLAAPAGWGPRDRARLAAALRASGVLERIRELQVSGDPGSTLFDGPGDPGFGLAMTLRDCSCFVRMTAAAASGDDGDDDDDDGEGEGEGEGGDDAGGRRRRRRRRRSVIIKLADVDKKNWEEKQTYWQASHRNLVEGGWYEGKEDPPMETHCLLGVGRR